MNGIKLFALMLFSINVCAAEQTAKQYVAEVYGRIKVSTTGSVEEVTLANVPSASTRRFLEAQIKKWEFHPMMVNNQPVVADSGFNFRIVTSTDSKGNFRQIAFHDVVIEPTQLEMQNNKAIKIKTQRVKPEYPYAPVTKGIEAKLKVAVKILSDGSIEEAAVSEISMLGFNNVTPESLLSKYQTDFSRSAISAIRKWRFSLDKLEQSDCVGGCIGSVMVTFEVVESKWKVYRVMVVPSIPWLVADQVKDVEVSKSKMVLFKNQPSSQPIDIGG